MDFRELQYVVTVADCRNVTQAAKQLYISQPSLSYALGQIEKEMGVKLFDRSQQPLALTDAGRIYVKTAREILQKRTELKDRLADLKDGRGARISLGIPAERAGFMLPPSSTSSGPGSLIRNSPSRRQAPGSCWNCSRTTRSRS